MNDPSGPRETIPCDLVAVSGGWTPTIHLHSQSGGGEPIRQVSRRLPAGSRHSGATFDRRGPRPVGSRRSSDRRSCRGHRRGRELRRHAERRPPPSPTATEAQLRHPALLAGGSAEGAPMGRLHERRHRQGRADRGARELHLRRASEALHDARHGDRSGQDQQPERPRHPGPGDGTLDSGSRHHDLPPALCAGIPVACSAAIAAARCIRRCGRLPAHREHELRGAVFDDYGGWRRPGYYPRPGED